MCAVVQAPATALAITISVVLQRDSVGVCLDQTWTLSTTQLVWLFVWNAYLKREEVHSSIIV